MNFRHLPPFFMHDREPAFHDCESVTAIEMVSRLYGKMNELITAYNDFYFKTKQENANFITSNNLNYTNFKMEIAQKINDFTNLLELRLKGMDKNIESTIKAIKENLSDSVIEIVSNMKDTGELSQAIMTALGDYTSILNEVLAKETSAGESRTAPQGTLQKIIEVATSYLRHNNELVYAHKHNDKELEGKDYANSAFILDGEVEGYPRYINGKLVPTNQYGRTGKAINCSTFALLVMMGVPYEQSRYNAENASNKFGSAGYCFNVWRDVVTQENYELYYNTRRLYERLAYLGCGCKILPDYSNVSAGDLVFYAPADKDENGIVIKEGGTVDQIGHVGVVLATHCSYGISNDSTPKLLIGESTSDYNTIQFNTYTIQDLKDKYVCFVGKPAYQFIPQQESEVLYKCNVSLNSYAQLRDYDLYNGEVVTLEFDYHPTSLENFLTMYIQREGSSQVQLYRNNKLKAFTQFTNVNELNRTYHMIITIPLVFTPEKDTDGNVTSRPFDCFKLNRLNVKVNGISEDEVNVLRDLKIWRGLPSREKETILYASTIEELTTQLLRLIPDVTADYQDKLSVIIRPTSKITAGDVQLIKADYYFDIYIRALFDSNTRQITKRLVAKSLSGTNEVSLVFVNDEWRYQSRNIFD